MCTVSSMKLYHEMTNYLVCNDIDDDGRNVLYSKPLFTKPFTFTKLKVSHDTRAYAEYLFPLLASLLCYWSNTLKHTHQYKNKTNTTGKNFWDRENE